MNTFGRRWLGPLIAVATTVVLAAGGCAFDPAAVPVPGTGTGGDTHSLRIEFADALNLPARAKVMAAGARVGTVSGVEIVRIGEGGGGYVVVTADIADTALLSTDTMAQLRQNTVLGDIHIELTPGGDPNAARLPPGATIPRTRTRPATQIEDTLTGISTLVQGGAVTRFQDIVNQLNAAFPADPAETRRISQAISADLVDLAANLHTADTFLTGLDATVATAATKKEALAELLTEPGVAHASAAVESIVNVIGVLGALGAVSSSLSWLAPLAQSGDAAARAFVPLALGGRPLDPSAPSNLNALVALIRDRIIPFVERGPKVNVTGVRVSSVPDVPGTDEQVESIVQTLRMIGAVR